MSSPLSSKHSRSVGLAASSASMIVFLTAACSNLGTETDNPAAPSGSKYLHSDVAHQPPTDVPQEDLALVADARTRLALSLYRAAAQGAESDENLAFAGESFVSTLTMLRFGADGETESEFAALFGDALPLERYQRATSAVQKRLLDSVTSETLHYSSFNSIWVTHESEVRSDYLDALARYLDAGVFSLDPTTAFDEHVRTINDWLAEKTDGHIVDFIEPGSLDSNPRLMAANATRIEGFWETPFDEERTEAGEFRLSDGQVVAVDFMVQLTELRAAFHFDWQGVELPLAGSEVSMFFILPTEGRRAEFEQSLNQERLRQIVDGLDREAFVVQLRLPRFGFSTQLDLSGALEALGLSTAFDARADFSRLSTEQLPLDVVHHHAELTVDERGVSVGAGSLISRTAASISPTIEFDRPFTFLLYDRGSETLLFVGRLSRPEGDVDEAREPDPLPTPSQVICAALDDSRCESRTTTLAECRQAFASESEEDLALCADCYRQSRDSMGCAQGCLSPGGDVCDASVCADFCPSYDF